MELAQHVQACEDSGGGAEETQALLDHCQTSLAPGAPVSHHVVEALANIARTQQGRESILHRDLVQRLGAGQWSSQDPLTATQVGVRSTVQSTSYINTTFYKLSLVVFISNIHYKPC